jgi:succinyl-diaminopimelate desuccinylase
MTIRLDPAKAAVEDHDSVVALTQSLVRVPSRGGVDPYDPVLEAMASWLDGHGLECRRLSGPGGRTVALVCEVVGDRPGPRWVLDACLDTAPFGDEAAWSRSPTSGEIVDGWMYGRGSADSKVGAAVFAHILRRMAGMADGLRGSAVLLLDVDEHTGGFGGAKAYFNPPSGRADVAGVMIGYPGIEHLVVGGRGVLRAGLHVHGVASHSGGSKSTPSAIAKAADLIGRLDEIGLPGGTAEFPPGGKLTVTSVHGGEGFSVTPDLCSLNVDIRLTPGLDDRTAEGLLRDAVNAADRAWPGTRPTGVEIVTRWPPFALPEGARLRVALLDAAAEAGLDVTAKVAGPSNIGNYLAGLAIPATAGFGVHYEGLHATDERILLDSIGPVQAVYHRALLTLMSA